MHAQQATGTALDQTGDLHRGGQGGEGSGDGPLKSGGRALAANVLWLDANPDARQDLAQASPGAVSVRMS